MANEEDYEEQKFHRMINTVMSEKYPLKYPKHWHKFVEIILIPEEAEESSVGVIKMNQEIYTLYPGDILIIWPGELHEVIENKNQRIMALQFPITVLTDREDLASYASLFKNYHMLEFEKYPELNQNLLFSISQIFTIRKEKEKIFQNTEMFICLLEMFMTFGNYIIESQEESESVEQKNDRLLKRIQIACNYIQENCEMNLTLEKVADHIGFSPFYFSRCFKKVTTFSFVEYLTIQRVKRIQALLTDEDMLITDAAYQAGFKSISTLNRVFKKYSGCSPSDYKKYYREDK